MQIKFIFVAIFFSILLFSACNNPSNTQSNKVEVVSVKTIHMDEAKKLLDEKADFVWIDARTPEEAALGKIGSAIVIDVKNPNFESEVSKLDKEKSYIVYCKAGTRSTRATNIMKELGFKHLTNMVDGYDDWKEKYK